MHQGAKYPQWHSVSENCGAVFFPVLPALFPSVWDVFQWSCSIRRGMVNFKDTVLPANRDRFCTKALQSQMLEKTTAVHS